MNEVYFLYKLIVIDDEDRIRRGICNSVGWKNLGFEVVADFEDGKEAIEYLKYNQVDVVLTDIKMAQISGLGVAKYVFDNLVSTKVVIMSGYKEFNYAKQAIEYNVLQYLLKPIDIEETQKTFMEIKEKLDYEKNLKFQLEHSQNKPIAQTFSLKKQFIYNMLMGTIRDANIAKIAEASGFDSDILSRRCCVLNFYSTNLDDLYVGWEYGKKRLNVIMDYLIEQTREFMQCFIIFAWKNVKKVLVVSCRRDDKLILFKRDVENFIADMKTHIKSLFGLNLEYNIEGFYNNMVDISLGSLKNISIEANNDTGDIYGPIDRTSYNLILERYKTIADTLISGSKENIFKMYDKLINEIMTLPVEYIRLVVLDLFLSISIKLSSRSIDLGNIFNISVLKDEIFSLEVEEIKDWGENLFLKITQYINDENSDTIRLNVNKAKEFIETNYNRDLSLEEVANYVFLSPAYFSRVFKKHTGKNFSEYLIETRIKKSIHLLRKNIYKIYEISEMVGYNNSKYFSKQFKEVTGFTPKEYCIKVLKAGVF